MNLPPTVKENAALLIRVIAPALRGFLAEEESRILKIVTVDDSESARELAVSGRHEQGASEGLLRFEVQDSDEESAIIDRLRLAISEFRQDRGAAPTLVAVEGAGLFAAGDDFSAADSRLRGVLAGELSAEDTGCHLSGRLKGRVAVVTGAAQGFGLEIARGLAAEGAHVVVTDINEAGAKSAADQLCEQYGSGRAMSVAINVTDSASIQSCMDQVVRTYGGLDIFVSNAGVLKAESVMTQSQEDFDFVTDVNYKGYYLGVQAVAPILAAQHKANPTYRSDIIQINSKSGLVGSKKNFAYAGSKFGGIGLTQSFALELVEEGIKVNSICPGNFFDGPLWSDPENGLFLQYLRAGKVPGASNIKDVRKFYEEKVPMGRGCQAQDVVTAILYVVDQVYETGQAIPVTGGQEMLR